jgi:hypothetical protein
MTRWPNDPAPTISPKLFWVEPNVPFNLGVDSIAQKVINPAKALSRLAKFSSIKTPMTSTASASSLSGGIFAENLANSKRGLKMINFNDKLEEVSERAYDRELTSFGGTFV